MFILEQIKVLSEDIRFVRLNRRTLLFFTHLTMRVYVCVYCVGMRSSCIGTSFSAVNNDRMTYL